MGDKGAAPAAALGGEADSWPEDAAFRAWLGISTDCVKLLNLDGRLLRMNDGGKAVMEVEDIAAIEGCAWPDFWKDAGNQQAREAVAAAQQGRSSHFRGAADTLKGTPKYWDVQVAPILDDAGRPQRILVVSHDISQERRSEQRLLEIARKVSENARLQVESVRRLLHDAPSITVVLRGKTHNFELMNEAALQLTGHRDLLGLTVREAFPDADGDALLAVLDQVYASGEPFVAVDAAVKLQRQRGGPYEDSFLNLVFQPIRDEDGEVSGIFIEGTDITARVIAERALAASERRGRLAQEVAGIGSLEVDVATGETRGSEEFWHIWGLEPRDSINISELEQLVVPEDSAIRSNLVSRHDGSAKPQVEYRIRRPSDGEVRWVARHIEFIHDAAGKPSQMIGVMQDITERKAIEEQKALLSREIEHRMKNTLAMVGAIAAQTLKGDGMKEARTAFVARLTALGTANDILMLRSWSSAPIKAVVEGALKPHMAGEDRITISGPNLWLNAKQALALSLGLHELATNAAKYGALSTSSGSVAVDWSIEDGADADRRFRFSWAERGGPTVAPPKRRGFGSRLIERVIAADFNGSVGINYAPQGVTCVLEAPLDGLQQKPIGTFS